MATLSDLGKEYAEYLENNAKNTNQAKTEIARRINSLTYTENQNPISKADKLKLVEEMSDHLKRKKTRDGFLIVEAANSSSYIDLINAIRNMLKG